MIPTDTAQPAAVPKAKYDPARAARGFAILLAVYLAVTYLIPWPSTIKANGPRLAGLFLATMLDRSLNLFPQRRWC